MNADPNSVFAELMRRPDIDQAAEQYGRMGVEMRQALAQSVPALSAWRQDGVTSNAACGSDYPGIDFDGQTRALPDYVVDGALPDSQYETALTTIGSIVVRYGFDSAPQRLHDAPGDHSAIFHNVHDDGAVTLGSATNTVLGVSVGCHLTAASKRRGHSTR